MSACWKVSWEEYLVMSSGINEPEYQLHRFNVEDGNVVFRTKREQKVLEDVISWANDSVIPERALSTGEPTKKVKKSKDTDGPSIGSIILENPNLLTNLRPKAVLGYKHYVLYAPMSVKTRTKTTSIFMKSQVATVVYLIAILRS